MRRHTCASSERSTAGKPSGLGSKLPSGRFRFAILAATVAAFLLVPVAQAAAGQTLKVNIVGSGQGEVVSGYNNGTYKGTPQIKCTYSPKAGVCENTMSDEEEGYEAVSLVATEKAGSKFVKWTVQSGEFEGCGTFPGCLPYVEPAGGSGTSEVTAIFCLEGQSEEECLNPGPVTPTALTIAKEGGEGTVASSPAGIECTLAKTGAECVHAFEINEEVTLTASPASGYAFSGWGGCLTHIGLTCTVKMDKAKTVKAKFLATPSLKITKAGTGAGKVAATGIGCDENCSEAKSAIKAGTVVTVKVTPAKGSEAAVFEGGTGSAESGCSGATCTFTISANSSVKVKFDAKPTSKLTVNVTGPAAYKGKVSGKGTLKGLLGSAISCGSGCTSQTETFFSADEVTLSAVAGTGYTFKGWTLEGSGAGTCTGTTTPCTVPTSSTKTLSAKFE